MKTKRHKVFFLLSTIFSFLNLHAQIYSFEDGLVPTNWSVISGTLLNSPAKYKHGTKSLIWTWNANSKVTVTSPTGLSTASTNKSGGIYFWIYNTVASSSKLVFSFLNNSNQVKCHLDFNLNFKGWRCLNAGFVADMNHDNTALTSMIVQAPPTGNGVIYFDHIEILSSANWDRMSDAQATVGVSSAVVDYWAVRQNGNFKTVSMANASQIASADTIIKRLDNWYMSTNKFPTATEFTSRKNGIKNQISYAITHNTGDLNPSVGSDGAVTGVGLYPDYAPSTIDGVTIRKFSNVETGSMLPLVYDYRMNNNVLSKTRWLNQIDWFYDQGWADGSALGSLRFEKLRSSGYFHSLFLMRNELGAARLERELNNLNWMGLWGNVNMPFPNPGENADQIRAMCVAKLVYALMQSDPNKRVAALTASTRYFTNAFSIATGFSETFKPDFSGYHHNGPYFSAYYPEALYAACWIYYLLHDTPFALSDSIYSTLKNCLLTFRISASEYDVPVGLCGRFPTGNPTVNLDLAAYAYLALSKATPDPELMAAFSRLWKPTISPLKDVIGKTGTDICLRTTMGETELCLQAAALKVTPEPNPRTTLYLPYSGLMINRNATRHVTLKGFSKYIWDYESEISTPTQSCHYLSYGQLEYTDLITGRANNNFDNTNYDWSRIPGTTTKYLPPASILFKTTDPYRNFSNDPFLGGVTLNDSTSLFSMKLHDNAFDQSFYANKSVFCFGNVLVCTGTNINCNDNATRTETTLFQQVVNTGESIKVNGKAVTTNLSGLSQPIIQDNLGNRFIVNSGAVEVSSANGIYTALINHGYGPTNQMYTYYMLLQSDDIQAQKYSNVATCPINIVRRDNYAHIVEKKDDNVRGYAIFNSTVPLNDLIVNQVNIKSLVMFKTIDSTTCRLVISDPDMHRPSGIDADHLDAVLYIPSTSFNYEIILNGLFKLDGVNSGVTLTNTDNTTKIALTVIDGKTYPIGLKSLSTDLGTTLTDDAFKIASTGIKNNYLILARDSVEFNINLFTLDGKILETISKVQTPYMLDASNLTKGVVIVSFRNKNKIFNQKLIIE